MNEQHDIAAVSEQETPKTSRFSRRARFGSMAAVMTAIVVAVILLLNVVMDTLETRYPLSVDLTADGTYTLCDESLALARGLDREVEVVVFSPESYFSAPNTGVEMFNTVMTQFYNTLRQYQLESNGKLSYTFIDLDANPTLATRYEAYSVSSGSILFLCGDRWQTISVNDLYSYDGSLYDGYTYSSEVERVIASKINLVSASVVKKAVILTGHNEVKEVIANMQTMLTSNGCDVQTLDIAASAEPPEDTGVFVIPAPAADYTVDEVAKLRGWLHNNGSYDRDLVVLVNPVATLPNLHEMLNDQYGIEVLSQIVCETDANNVYSMNTYYTYADVASTDYTEELAEDRALMPLTRPLKLNITDSTDEAMYAKALVTFGETAQVQDLATALSEESQSAETTAVAADEYPIVGAAYTSYRMFDNDEDRYHETDVLVIGSAMFAYANTMDITSACNEELFLNTFRGLTGLESVISVSNRSLTQDTLDFGGSLVPTVLGIYVFTIGLPLIMIVVSIVVFVRRRRL